MSTFTWSDVAPFLISGYNFGGTGTTTMEVDIPGKEMVTEEATGIGSTWEQHLRTGEYKATGPFTHKSFHDDTATTGTLAAMRAGSGSHVLLIGYEGGTAGTRAVALSALRSTFGREQSKGTLVKLSGSHLVTGQVDDQTRILKALSTVTANGDTTGASVDGAAASSGGGAAYFFVTDLTLHTATNLALKVQDSADNVTFADLASATVVTASPSGEAVVVTGTVRRYLAALWSWTGGAGASSTATILVGFARR